MSSSGYVAWAVTAGEVPTTAYWNILGSNDSSFNTGNGFNDGILQSRHFAANTVQSTVLALSSGFTNGVASYTNAGNAGGTFYFINLGGMKMCWGMTNALSVTAATNAVYNISLPASFFTTLQSVTATPTGGTDFNTIFWGTSSNATSTSQVSLYFYFTPGSATTGSTPVSMIAIGT